MPEDPRLTRAREAFERRAWGEACAQFTALDAELELDLDDLGRFASAAYLVGEEQRCVDLLARSHHAATRAGDIPTAAGATFWIAFVLFSAGAPAQASGWLQRGRHALEGHDDCAVHGYFLVLEAVQRLNSADPDAALERFVAAHDCGRRFADRDLVALGGLGQGQALVMRGDVRAGLPFLDEVMVSVTAGEVSPIVAGIVYCAVIDACQQIFDIARAREWTAALSRWCEEQPDLVPYRGQCLVHRAQILRLRGEWTLALEEARRAAEALSGSPDSPAQGAAMYEEAEVYRLRGELDRAEERYRQAAEWGHETQPGVALLRLAQGRVEAARVGLSRALESTTLVTERPRLLAAEVEIALAAGDLPAARAAADELGHLGGLLGATFLEALAVQAEATVLRAEGRSREALSAGRHAWELWRRLDVPFEAARSRLTISSSIRDLGDPDAAEAELAAARGLFEQLHADSALLLDAVEPHPADKSDHGLSPREVEVLRLVAEGKSNRAIAADLVLSEKTVARHLANIFVKLDVSSRTAATAYAFQHDLV